MISPDMFQKTEPLMIHLVNLWNNTESDPTKYSEMFISDPHGLSVLVGYNTTYHDWQIFLTDSRVQDYIDKIIYTQAGIIVNKYMKDGAYVNQATATQLNSAIKYRDDHKPSFATPVQYIYIQTPLTEDEKAFLPDVPENNRTGF